MNSLFLGKVKTKINHRTYSEILKNIFMKKKRKSDIARYYIMDGRARYNVDEATILCCSDTLREAKIDLRLQQHYIRDAVIWDTKDNKIVK